MRTRTGIPWSRMADYSPGLARYSKEVTFVSGPAMEFEGQTRLTSSVVVFVVDLSLLSRWACIPRPGKSKYTSNTFPALLENMATSSSILDTNSWCSWSHRSDLGITLGQRDHGGPIRALPEAAGPQKSESGKPDEVAMFCGRAGERFWTTFWKNTTGGAPPGQPRPRTCAKSGRIRDPVHPRPHIKDSCSTGRIPVRKRRILPKRAKIESLFALRGTNPASLRERALIWAHSIPVDGTKCPGQAQTPQIWCFQI